MGSEAQHVVPSTGRKGHGYLRRVVTSAAICLMMVSAPPIRAEASSVHQYLGVASTGIIFVNLTLSNSNVAGAIFFDAVTGSIPGVTITPRSASFTGVNSNGQVTLVSNSPWVPHLGSLNGGSLSLEVQLTGGSLMSFHLTPSSETTYNSLLAKWNLDITRADAIGSDAQAMQVDVTFDVGEVDTDLITVQDGLGVVQIDNDALSTCGDVSAEYRDAAWVANDARTILSEANQYVSPDLRKDQKAINLAPRVWAAYWQLHHGLVAPYPTLSVPPLTPAITAGKGDVTRAVIQLNTEIRQDNSYIAQAYAMPNAAQKAMHCGPMHAVPAVPPLTWNGSQFVSGVS